MTRGGALAFATLVACAPQEGPRFSFEARPLAEGLVHGAEPPQQLPDVKGGGFALFDLDEDGDLDVFSPGGAPAHPGAEPSGARVFLNDGEGTFLESPAASHGLAFAGRGFGVALADVDGNGHEDLFVCAQGQNQLFLARGAGQYEEATESSSLGQHSRWSTAASFGDLDGDGDLDLYVANYVQFDLARPPEPTVFRGATVFGGPLGLPGEPDEVYENLGGGRFQEVTDAWGFTASPSYGLGALIVDLDGDGSAEVFVGNDSQQDFLFVRGEDGRFEERGLPSGLGFDENGFGQATMGIVLGDLDEDGEADLFTTNFMADRNTLHRGRGQLQFEDATRRSGLGRDSVPFLGWAAGLEDLDQDGVAEVLVWNGHVYGQATCEQMGWSRRQEPLLFVREEGRYERYTSPAPDASWLATPRLARGGAFGDLDGDGALDLVVSELSGPITWLRSRAPRGRGLAVSLRDPGSANPRGLGARVRLTSGAPEQTRWLVSGDSYQSAGPAEVWFGLGRASGPIEVEVRWPDGQLQVQQASAEQGRLEVLRAGRAER